MSSSSTEKTQEEPSDEYMICVHRQLQLQLAASLAVAKLSHRGTCIALVLTPAIQSLGHNPAEYQCSFSTIRKHRLEHRENTAKRLKGDFNPNVPLVIHWDGKLLEDITGREMVDRLPILISGGIDYLLDVPKLNKGTGSATTDAVFNAAKSWGVLDKVKGTCFDTTASNIGGHKGACILLEQKLEEGLAMVRM